MQNHITLISSNQIQPIDVKDDHSCLERDEADEDPGDEREPPRAVHIDTETESTINSSTEHGNGDP